MEMSCGSFAAQLLAMVGLLEGRRVPEMEFSVETNVGGESILFVRLLTTLSVEAFRLGCDAASLVVGVRLFETTWFMSFLTSDTVPKRRV